MEKISLVLFESWLENGQPQISLLQHNAILQQISVRDKEITGQADKLSRRNMQIKDLKAEIKDLNSFVLRLQMEAHELRGEVKAV